MKEKGAGGLQLTLCRECQVSEIEFCKTSTDLAQIMISQVVSWWFTQKKSSRKRRCSTSVVQHAKQRGRKTKHNSLDYPTHCFSTLKWHSTTHRHARPKNNFCKPKEIWNMLNNTKECLGEKSRKHVKTPLIKQLADNDDDENPFSPASFKTACKITIFLSQRGFRRWLGGHG